MDNDDIPTREAGAIRPIGSSAGGFSDERPGMTAGAFEEGERNPVFSQLVKADGDIIGLVAYSIYKQNKLDWLLAFQRAFAREPNEQENAAYIIGEATPRRLATYRHLAESTLAGSGPDVPGESGRSGEHSGFQYRSKPIGTQRPGATLVVYAALVVVVIIAIIVAVKFLPRT
ncbi:MAG: hypothetical protein NVSMB26_06400 [Beijerinckiaceae bacterium]